MKQILLYIVLLVMLPLAFASSTLSRSMPATVAPGQTFTVTYTASSTDSLWYIFFTDTVSSCAPGIYENSISGGEPGSQTQTKTFTAPMSGSCTFSGTTTITVQGGQSREGPNIGGTSSIQVQSTPSCPYSAGYSTTCEKMVQVTQAYRAGQCSMDFWVSEQGVLMDYPDELDRTNIDLTACTPVSTTCTYSAWTPDVSSRCAGISFTQTRTVISGTGCTDTTKTSIGTKPQSCASPSSVACGQAITDANGCGSCPSGSQCQSGYSCNSGSCQPLSTGSCALPWGGSIANQTTQKAYQVSSGATCPSETRTCTNGVLSGTYQYQSCTPTGPYVPSGDETDYTIWYVLAGIFGFIMVLSAIRS